MDALRANVPSASGTAGGELPHQLKLLCLAPERPDFAPLILQLDAADRGAPVIQWCATPSEAMARLRDETFHCIIVADARSRADGASLFADVFAGAFDRTTPDECRAAVERPSENAANGEWASEERSRGDAGRDAAAYDAFDVIDAVRSSGCREPIVLLSPGMTEGDWELLARSDAEVLVSRVMWASAALWPTIRRALNRYRLHLEVSRLESVQRQRVDRERREAEQLLAHQAALLGTLGRARRSDGFRPVPGGTAGGGGVWVEPSHEADAVAERVRAAVGRLRAPEPLRRYYHELLRSYVIMGSGNLADEIGQLADVLRASGIGPADAFALHVATVYELIRGLGQRSTRHVMTRADLLVIELLLHMSGAGDADRTQQHLSERAQMPDSDGMPKAA
ncbi:MAG: hypothetical protein D6725_07740 [Planctomycetota bacterium]|nr:MAG: hypothetical protein D6725_07740 [Planctomycetota bacterium]